MMMIDRSIDREVYTVQSWQLGNRHDRKSVQYQTHGSYLGRMKGRGESPNFKNGVLLASYYLVRSAKGDPASTGDKKEYAGYGMQII